ncbi:ferredoxin--nitrite reductase [Natronococcus pandeyae]|uniref:Ferredoxin--nitrite reductase n=1 Tax=Natronococcus pandeyae TaxID=2055836 RepID=A0A8J8Q3I8_9EURY|nr:rhodanese-like domain-containing protein [Natronococcus pandeyae]TYL38284.1 ferredoxin--nitrite reductase [Natronococcus pandeyae]
MTETPTVVSPAWLETHCETVTVVDVRDRREYEDLGHVPDAVNVPADRFRDPSSVAAGKLPDPDAFADLLGERGIDSGDSLVAVGDENGVLAARFLLTASVYGHEGELYLLDGGLEAWREEHELTTQAPALEPTSYEAELRDDAPIVDRQAVEAAAEGDAVVVDTRTPAEYDQSHIPGAVQLGWEALLDDAGRLKPDDELEDLLTERGISRDERIVLYCNTARRLSHTYVVLRSLGYGDVRFYEGSLTDWLRANSPDWDPIQLYENVREVASNGFEALPRELGEDVFGRLHLIGLYTQRQEGYFMLRTKVPGGILTAEQARAFGEIAEEFATAPEEHGGSEQNPVHGDGFLDVTTRQGLQLHWIRIEDMPEIWDRYDEVGLTTIQASGNTLRNVVACPAAGLGDETIDVRPIAERVADRFEGDRELANLPRKLKVSVAGCHENCGRAEIQDLGFTPAIKGGRDGFAVKVGGGLSDGPRAATDLGIFVEPNQVADLSEAAAKLFIDHGSYLDTAVNRLRFIVAEYGVDAFRDELERYAPFAFEPYDEAFTTDYRGDHVGVHEQDDGTSYVGVNIPTGRIGGDEFAELAALAEEYGSGQLRLTPNQNVVLTGVPDASLEALQDEPLLSTYSPDPGPFSRGIVTCTGREFCKYGVVETKGRGYRWAKGLDEWAEETGLADALETVRVHMSGCSASCAQPQIADVGLRGEVYRDDYESTRAADVGLGGDLENDAFVDWLVGSVPIDGIPSVIERTVRAYEIDREDGESFADWTRRMPDTELRRLVAEGPEPNRPVVGTEVS